MVQCSGEGGSVVWGVSCLYRNLAGLLLEDFKNVPGAGEGKHDIQHAHYQNKENKSIALTVCAASQLFHSILSEIKRLPLKYYIHISSLAPLITAMVFQY